MKKFLLVTLFLAYFNLFSSQVFCEVKQHKFVFVVTSYNNINFYEKNLSSIFSQKNKNFRLIYIDDASTDNTYEAVDCWLKNHNFCDQTILIKREKNLGGLQNIYEACHKCSNDEIICLVDGDDWLASNDVLDILESYYNNGAWLTYGQFIHHPSAKLGLCSEYSKEELISQKTRSLPWRCSHLKTFYAGLFKKIKKEDLVYDDQFITSATDLAIMFPMLDMATTNVRYIPEILYVYNNQNPLSHHQIRHDKQRFFRDLIRSKKVYTQLTSFDSSND